MQIYVRVWDSRHRYKIRWFWGGRGLSAYPRGTRRGCKRGIAGARSAGDGSSWWDSRQGGLRDAAGGCYGATATGSLAAVMQPAGTPAVQVIALAIGPLCSRHLQERRPTGRRETGRRFVAAFD